MTSQNEKKLKKIERKKIKFSKLSNEFQKISETANNKELVINELNNKLESMNFSGIDKSHKKNIVSESEFWKMEENSENKGKYEIITLKEIAKNKSLWINHIEDKKNPLEGFEKIKLKLPDSPQINKLDLRRQLVGTLGKKPKRRSLEPLTPISYHQSPKHN